MAIVRYQVLAHEADGVEIEFPQEIPMDASIIYFDDSEVNFTADNVQDAIKESSTAIDDGASAGYIFGKNGATPAGSWLINNDVPSNIVGLPITFSGAYIDRIYVRNQEPSTFTVGIYEHNGVTYTLIDTVVVTASRGNKKIDINYSVAEEQELAAKIESGSAKTPKVVVVVKGTT